MTQGKHEIIESSPDCSLLTRSIRLWGIYLVTENKTQIDDLVHFTLREWSRLSYNVTEAETERAKAQLKASILLSLDGTTAVAEDIGRQIVTTGRRMDPEEVERVVGSISEKDVMSFARRKLWDQDVAVSAVGSIEGLLDYNRYVHSRLIPSPYYPARVTRHFGSKRQSPLRSSMLTPCAESGTI